jgi:hypothetical protein
MKNYDTDLFVPEVWGPSYWEFFHTSLFQYPENPTIGIKKIYYNMIAQFGVFLPDEKMKSFYNKLLDAYPVSPYLDNRKSLVKWGWFFHNKVNEKLKKPKISIDDFYKHYYNAHKNYTVKINMKWLRSIQNIIIYFVMISLLIYISYVMYTYSYLVI